MKALVGVGALKALVGVLSGHCEKALVQMRLVTFAPGCGGLSTVSMSWEQRADLSSWPLLTRVQGLLCCWIILSSCEYFICRMKKLSYHLQLQRPSETCQGLINGQPPAAILARRFYWRHQFPMISRVFYRVGNSTPCLMLKEPLQTKLPTGYDLYGQASKFHGYFAYLNASLA